MTQNTRWVKKLWSSYLPSASKASKAKLLAEEISKANFIMFIKNR